MAYLPIFWSNSVAYQGYNVPAAAIAEKIEQAAGQSGGGGGGGTLPEEYYQETYQKIQVPNSLDWTQIPSTSATIADSSSVSLETVAVDDPDNPVEIHYISDKNEVDSNGYPHYKIWIGDKIWRLYTNYDEYTEETPVINEEDFTSIYDQNAFDAIIDSFETHTENQSFQQKFAAEKLTAGEGIVIDNQNKINSSLVGEVLSKAWTETDLGGSIPESYDPNDLNINRWIIIPSGGSYYIINFQESLYGFISAYEESSLTLHSFTEIVWEDSNYQEISDFWFYPDFSDINYYGITAYFTYNGTAYSIEYASLSGEKLHIRLNELDFGNIFPNVTASVYMGEKSFIYDDNSSTYYLCQEGQSNLEVTFLDSEGNTTSPYFLMYSYLYQWNGNIYLYDTYKEAGILVYYNINNDVVEDYTNNTITITLHEIYAENLGFNFEGEEYYDLVNFYNNGYFAQSFWRKKFTNPNTYEETDNLYFDFEQYDMGTFVHEAHYQLNQETGLWESRSKGDYFISQGGGVSVFPNRFAVEAFIQVNSYELFTLSDSYFFGPIENNTETSGSFASSWEQTYILTYQKTHEGLIPNIHIYEHPEFAIQPKLISKSSFISIEDTNKIVFHLQDILRQSNTQSSYGHIIDNEGSYIITSRATRSFLFGYSSCIALSIVPSYQGTLSFSFIDPIKETGKIVDNVKVYFKIDSTQETVSAYCIYAGIGTIKPKITYKIVPLSELQKSYIDGLPSNMNDQGDIVDNVLCFKVDLGQHDGVSSLTPFYKNYLAEKATWYEGMVEVNMTVNSFDYHGVFCKQARLPDYYELELAGSAYQYYATPQQKYLPYLRDKNIVSSADIPVVIYGNQTDQTTGDPIPNPDYVNYDIIWTEVPEKTGLIV